MKMTMNLRAALLALAWMSWPGSVWAQQENPYDVLGKALMPIVGVFAADANGQPVVRAMVLDAHLVEASGTLENLQGETAHLALMTPDRLLARAPIAGQMLTVCRDGDTLWATPGSEIQSILGQVTAAATPGKKKKKKKLAEEEARVFGPLALPVPQKQLVFLPILFQVADAGSESVGAIPCRVLDVQLMPQLAKSLHAEDWTARMWVGPDYGIARIALSGPDWSGTVAIDKLAFPSQLPETAFQPQGTDVLRLTAGEFLQLAGQIGRQ